MKRKAFVAASLAVVVGIAGVAKLRAAPAGGEGRGARLMQLRDDLGITPEQKKQLRELLVAHRQEIAAVARPIVEHRRALQEAATAEPVDEAAVRAAADQIGKDLGDAALLAGKLRKEVAQVLTPEQLKTIGGFGDEIDARIDAFLDRLETGGRR